MGLIHADFAATEKQSLVLICDSWVEISPLARTAITSNAGLVDMLMGVADPSLRHVDVISRPEAVLDARKVLGQCAEVSEHWVMPFSEVDFSRLTLSFKTRSAFEESLGKEKIKSRHASEATKMTEAGLSHSDDPKRDTKAVLRAMREVRRQTVSEYDE